MFVERVLTGAGYAVGVASTGPEALSIAGAQGPFDLYVIDVAMPGMRGDDLVQRLRRTDPTVKVLYFTGYRDLLLTDPEFLWQGEAFIDKPTTPNDLLQTVSLVLYGDIQGPL